MVTLIVHSIRCPVGHLGVGRRLQAGLYKRGGGSTIEVLILAPVGPILQGGGRRAVATSSRPDVKGKAVLTVREVKVEDATAITDRGRVHLEGVFGAKRNLDERNSLLVVVCSHFFMASVQTMSHVNASQGRGPL